MNEVPLFYDRAALERVTGGVSDGKIRFLFSICAITN